MQIKRNDRKYFYVSSLISFILKHFYSTLKRGGGEREREREEKRKEGRERGKRTQVSLRHARLSQCAVGRVRISSTMHNCCDYMETITISVVKYCLLAAMPREQLSGEEPLAALSHNGSTRILLFPFLQFALAHGRIFDSNRYTRANFFECRHNGEKGGELLRVIAKRSARRHTVAQLHCTRKHFEPSPAENA